MNDDHISAAALLDCMDLAWDDPQIVQTLSSMLKAPDYPQLFSSFRGEDGQSPPEKAVKFVDALDKALGYDGVVPETRNRLHRVLRETCARVGTLPTPYHLDNNQIKKLNDVPFAAGGYSCIWRGSYKGEDVSIKTINVLTTDNIKHLTEAWCREIVVCRYLSHPNILSFLGASSTESHPLCIVSKWMPHGNISEFLKHYGQFNRRPLLIDIVRGLNYLHSQNVVHGDLKGQNVLIDDNKNAVLCDFGLASITVDAGSPHASPVNNAGSIRWMAPERLSIFDPNDPDDPDVVSVGVRVTKESDMYSLAMVVIEIFAGHSPFSDTPDAGVILKLAQQRRPKKPDEAVHLGLTDPLWETVKACWKTRPSDRLTVTQVLEAWEKEINGIGLSVGEQGEPLSTDKRGRTSSWWRFLCGGSEDQYAE